MQVRYSNAIRIDIARSSTATLGKKDHRQTLLQG